MFALMRSLADVKDWAARNRRLPLFVALVLHNCEEALTFAAYRPRVEMLASQALHRAVPIPSTMSFVAALLVVTAMAAILLWPIRSLVPVQHQKRPEDLVAIILLVNIVVSHVPLAYLLGGYAPGVVSAVMINLPVGLFVVTARRPRR